MRIIKYSDEEGKNLTENLSKRNQPESGNFKEIVSNIVSDVKLRGDEALFEYTEKFDKFKINSSNIKVTEKEIKKAYEETDKDLIEVIKKAIVRIERFHKKQKQNSWFEVEESGEILGQLIRAIETAGVYVPGGKAAYPSSVLMNVLPAKVAGVKNIIMVTPPDSNGNINPTTIVASKEAGVTEIYKIGGAQSIAALAFGTNTIPKVSKITGPGNIYVTLAKREVFGYVSIDSIAGPSEILIIADETANVSFVAADLLSQAEHDELASAILITDNESFAENVAREVKLQLENLNRKEIAKTSLENYGAIIIVKDLNEATKIANVIAPEHLEIATNNPFDLLSKIKNAGSIFLGNFSAEPLGDYMAGPNHILPTGGTAKFFSPLSVDDFVKKSGLIYFTEESFKEIAADVEKFALSEGLQAHAESVKIRREALDNGRK